MVVAVATLKTHRRFLAGSTGAQQMKKAKVGPEPPADVSPGDFPLDFEYHPSFDGLNTNVLLLLHGLGDQPRPFAQLALKMRLPQTCSMALKGPIPVPLFPEAGAWTFAFELAHVCSSTHATSCSR